MPSADGGADVTAADAAPGAAAGAGPLSGPAPPESQKPLGSAQYVGRQSNNYMESEMGRRRIKRLLLLGRILLNRHMRYILLSLRYYTPLYFSFFFGPFLLTYKKISAQQDR